MTGWDDLSQHVLAHYHVVKVEPYWIGIELAFEVGGQSTSVRIKLERVTVFDSPWVLVIAAICSEKHIDALGALRYNALIAVGGLVVEHERCYLRAALPLDELGKVALARTIGFVAHEALKLRRDFVPDPGVLKELFGNFGE